MSLKTIIDICAEALVAAATILILFAVPFICWLIFDTFKEIKEHRKWRK